MSYRQLCIAIDDKMVIIGAELILVQETIFCGLSFPDDLLLEEGLGREGANFRKTPTHIITTNNSKNKQEALLNMKEVSGCRLITFCSCFEVIRADCELFKQVTMDDSSTG